MKKLVSILLSVLLLTNMALPVPAGTDPDILPEEPPAGAIAEEPAPGADAAPEETPDVEPMESPEPTESLEPAESAGPEENPEPGEPETPAETPEPEDAPNPGDDATPEAPAPGENAEPGEAPEEEDVSEAEEAPEAEDVPEEEEAPEAEEALQAEEAPEAEEDPDRFWYELDEATGILTIYGTEMPDWESSIKGPAPWYEKRTSIRQVVFAGKMRNIGAYAFYGCSSLTSIDLPDDIVEIHQFAFQNCTYLSTIRFGSGLSSLDRNVFMGCGRITEVWFTGRMPTAAAVAPFPPTLYRPITYYPRDDDSWTEAGRTAIGANLQWAWPLQWELDSGTGVLTLYGTVMPNYHYANETPPWYSRRAEIRRVKFVDPMRNIGRYAFYNCSNLNDVTLPDSLTEIRADAFYGCTSLTSIRIPGSVTTLGGGAFASTGLTSVTIPGTVTEIDGFGHCASLTSVTISPGATSIKLWAFRECPSLTSVSIPGTVTSIASEAFYGCSSLASLELPGSVTSIGYGAFQGCSSLTSITIPDGVTKLSDSTFRNCSKLTSVQLGSGLSSLGACVFSGCTALTKVRFTGSMPSIAPPLSTTTSTGVEPPFPANITAAAYYPPNDTSWTEDGRTAIGSGLKWTAWDGPTEIIPEAGSGYTVQDDVLYGVSPGTLSGELQKKLENGGNAVILKADGTPLPPVQPVGTGCTVGYVDGTIAQTSIVVCGDVDGDGMVSDSDEFDMRQHILGLSSLETVYLQAAMVSPQSDKQNVTIFDVIEARKYIEGVTDTLG